MAAVFMSSSAEKSFSPYRQLKNMPRRNSTIGANYLVSKPTENLDTTNNIIHGGAAGGGLLLAPPPSLHFSFPPSASLLNPYYQNNHHQLQQQQPQPQPPLLPLPIIPNKPLHNSLPSRTRSLSSSPSNRKNNKTRDQSLTPKRSKSKQLIMAGKVEDQPKKDSKPTETQATTKSLVMTPPSANPIGPDPNDLPKLLASSYLATGIVAKDLEMFSGSVFTLSPPPSSLPLPKFSLRPKLSCNAEAAGVDAGATDDLRRLLRLR
ncbi:hypothetical protein COLO4_26124 [Corchorus olitorius]|uniref:Uncharacterized protein n=1 Tax=Corchorus olitorius TaxID=93759 RepID=A0A1R3HYZ2_9ROSI|nr:hypothetical protein COLO4_26124 [Corchorus olitorius]